MIIEYVIQHITSIVVIFSVLMFLLSLRMFKSTDEVFENDIADAYLKARGGYVKSDKLFIVGDHSGEFEIRSEWLGSSGSSASHGDWEYISGTAIQINDFNPYKYPFMKEHEVMRCKYCKRQNKSTNEFCLGCGAPL